MVDDDYVDACAMTRQVDVPIDLSRRCDSVETRKTPSPYTSSAFGENSPSLSNDSPNSLRRSISGFSSHNRSDTPPNHYQTYLQHYTPGHESARYAYDSSPSSSPTEMKPMEHKYLLEQVLTGDDEKLNPFILQALQHKFGKLQDATMQASKQMKTEPVDYPVVSNCDRKIARPFNAYPQNPLSIAASDTESERYNVFRQQFLDQMRAANGGQVSYSNPNMSRKVRECEPNTHLKPTPEAIEVAQIDASSNKDSKDEAYYERRRRNNAAAKKSRDRRRIKEDEIAIRAAYLERENFELKIELANAQRQLASFLQK